jgi:hypothetical protein
MFIALYEFKVKSGFERQFEENWKIVTEAIFGIRGSLGSRLHISKDGTYVAYAQSARQLMKDACISQTVMKLMNVCDELLKS